MSINIAPNAQTGFENASSYDNHRPSYPPDSVQNLLQNLSVSGVTGARILEIGAGTGKFTSLLAARNEGYEIIAVEPHQEMRQVLEQKDLKGVKVVAGNATSMDAVEDGWADCVVVAQAFHWFANMDALHEIHKKLAPGGALGLIWNIEDYNSQEDFEATTQWEHKLKEIMWTFDDQDPRFRHAEWQKVFEDQNKTTPLTIQAADPLFSLPLGENIEKWTVWLSKEAVWGRFRSISYIARLKGSELEDTRNKVFAAMEGEDVERNEKGELALHGQTVSYWTSSIPSTTLKSGG